MANYIVKISPEQDAYVYWCQQADAPHYGGTRQEMVDFLNRTGENQILGERFGRADETGTSAKPYTLNGVEHPGFFAWNDPGASTFVAEQRGVVRRENLMEMWRCIAVGRPYPHILEPFPDGHMVGWKEEAPAT